MSFFLGPDTSLPYGLYLRLPHQVLNLDPVLPVLDVLSLLKVFCNVFKMLVPGCRRFVGGLRFEYTLFTGAESAGEDDLGAQVGSGRAVGQGLGSVSFLGVGTVGSFGGEG